MLNWTHANPHYCLAAPVVANPIVVGCQEAPESEAEAFINGVGNGKKQKKGSKVKGEKKEKEGKESKDEKNDKKKEEKGEKGEDEKKSDKGEESEELDLIEDFFEDDDVHVIFLPFMDTYNSSKEYQSELNFL